MLGLVFVALHESTVLGISVSKSSADGIVQGHVIHLPTSADSDQTRNAFRDYWVPIGSFVDKSSTMLGKSVLRHIENLRSGSGELHDGLVGLEIDSARITGPVWAPIYRQSSATLDFRFRKALGANGSNDTLFGDYSVEFRQSTWGIRSTAAEIDAVGRSIAHKIWLRITSARAPAR